MSSESEFEFRTWEGSVGGKPFSFRELTVKENDDISEAARNADGTNNGRLFMRMMVAKCSVDPKIAIDDIAKMPLRIYGRLMEIVNDLNTEEVLAEDEDEKNV